MRSRAFHHARAQRDAYVGQPSLISSASEAGRRAHGGSGAASAAKPVDNIYDPNRKVEVVVYNMERFAKDCVSVFCQLSGYSIDKVGTAPTPFLDEANDPPIMFEEAPY